MGIVYVNHFIVLCINNNSKIRYKFSVVFKVGGRRWQQMEDNLAKQNTITITHNHNKVCKIRECLTLLTCSHLSPNMEFDDKMWPKL